MLNSSLKIAIVTDWMTNYGGAESVISAFHELFPEAPIYTTMYKPEKMRELGNLQNVKTTYLNKIPGRNIIAIYYVLNRAAINSRIEININRIAH